MRYFVFGTAGGCNDGDHRVDFQECETLDEAKKYVQEAKQDQYDYSWEIVKGLRLAVGDDQETRVLDPEFGVGI
jgi:hypothetical protein